jgi:hypothetical protein
VSSGSCIAAFAHSARTPAGTKVVILVVVLPARVG